MESNVSYMKTLVEDIQERLDSGQTVDEIAEALEVPCEWVECVAEWSVT
jgi:DNA-directed RNA polymerase specialized sigma subunit